MNTILRLSKYMIPHNCYAEMNKQDNELMKPENILNRKEMQNITKKERNEEKERINLF